MNKQKFIFVLFAIISTIFLGTSNLAMAEYPDGYYEWIFNKEHFLADELNQKYFSETTGKNNAWLDGKTAPTFSNNQATRPDKDTVVDLTAVISRGTQELTKHFTILIPKAEQNDLIANVSDAYASVRKNRGGSWKTNIVIDPKGDTANDRHGYIVFKVDPNAFDGQDVIDDDIYPTYCGTGTEDYFGGAWCFSNNEQNQYVNYSTPFMGYPQIIKPDGYYSACQRHGLYRWHIMDPIFFNKNFKATIQALGWRYSGKKNRRFLQLQDDIASTAFWYQTEPHNVFPVLPDVDYRENI